MTTMDKTATVIPRPRAAGFTLIEIMVAVLILAIGLLGVAGLEATGLRQNTSAYQRSQATLLAYDISERMRANLPGVTNGDYNGAAGTQQTNCTTTQGCSSAQMAANDIYEWKQAVAARLPSGQGVVCIDSTPNDGTSATSPQCDGVTGAMYAIKIWWDDNHSGNLSGFFSTTLEP